MLAIPLLRSRVAPVLNWCSTVLIVPGEAVRVEEGIEIRFENIQPFQLLRELKERAVQTVICGALTEELLSQGERLGITIIPGVAGEVAEVLLAYRESRLDGEEFRLPGCPWAVSRGKRACGEYRGNPGEGAARVRNAPSTGPTAPGICPRCGREIPRQGRRGAVLNCPGCSCPLADPGKRPSRPR